MILVGIYACKDPVSEFNREINIQLRDDEGISETEWETLVEMTMLNSELEEYQDTAILRGHILNMAERLSSSQRSNGINYPPSIWIPNSEAKAEQVYDLYIENSGSMFGYMEGNTDFKKSIFDLLTRINGKGKKVNINLINNETHPIDTKLEDFMEFLQPQNVKRYGETGSSELNKIFRVVTQEWNRLNQIDSLKDKKHIAILVSDYIYSLRSNDVTDGLADQKYGTKIVFQNISQQTDCAVLIIKSNSFFDGQYYTFRSPNSGQKIRQNRPYYIWIIADSEEILNFQEEFNIEELDGYENHMVIYNTQESDLPYHSILTRTNKKGRFRKTKGQSNQVSEIEAIELNKRRGEELFEFSLAIDLSLIPVDDNYKINPNMYELISSNGDKFEIVEIEPIVNNYEPNDKKYIGKASHLLTFRTYAISPGVQTLNLKMKKLIPEWVLASSTEDDATYIDSTKTFGLQYLIEGVNEAYDERGEEHLYFSIPLTLKR